MFDVIIIGAGPAGLTSALYCLRSGKSTLILEKETIGGQISLSPRVENFPSIKAISGSEFSDRLFEQVTQLGAEFELDRVTNLVKDKDVFEVTTEYSKYEAKSVIIATGVQHRHIGVEGEDELVGKGVSYCAVCDGAFYKGEEVALIGDANSALQYALLLSNYCNRVTVCTLFDSFFATNY
ncbi:MAG: FAD-dependent oxidoreductase, partial [Clostridia bacterium]